MTQRVSGFTLFEVLVSLILLAIVAAVAIPAFAVWLPDYRLKEASRQAFSNFQLAKLTAIKRIANCTISFNQMVDGAHYDYVVFVDLDNDLEFDPGEETVIRNRWSDYGSVGFDLSKGGGDGLTFLANDEGCPAIAFRPSGLPVNNLGGLGMGSVFLKNRKDKKTSVVVSSAGNIRIK
jgi:prepilin-type N-terminal cleavage/methylation domain-containing protein